MTPLAYPFTCYATAQRRPQGQAPSLGRLSRQALRSGDGSLPRESPPSPRVGHGRSPRQMACPPPVAGCPGTTGVLEAVRAVSCARPPRRRGCGPGGPFARHCRAGLRPRRQPGCQIRHPGPFLPAPVEATSRRPDGDPHPLDQLEGGGPGPPICMGTRLPAPGLVHCPPLHAPMTPCRCLSAGVCPASAVRRSWVQVSEGGGGRAGWWGYTFLTGIYRSLDPDRCAVWSASHDIR